MSNIVEVLQSSDPVSYKLWYGAGTALTVGSTAWVVGKVLRGAGDFIEPMDGAYKSKIAKTLQRTGDVLSFPGDQLCVGGKIALEQVIDLIKNKKNNSQSADGLLIKDEDTPELRAQFQEFLSPDRISPEVANIISLSSDEEREQLYSTYRVLPEEERFILEPVLQNYRQQITCMIDIFLVIYGWQAGMEDLVIVHDAGTKEIDGDSRGNEDLSDDSEDGESLTYEQILQMKHDWKLTHAEMDFLLSSGHIYK